MSFQSFIFIKEHSEEGIGNVTVLDSESLEGAFALVNVFLKANPSLLDKLVTIKIERYEKSSS